MNPEKPTFVFRGTLEPRTGVLGTHVIIASYGENDKSSISINVPGSDNLEAIDRFKLSARLILENLQEKGDIERCIADGSLVLEVGEDVPGQEFQEPDRFSVRIPDPRV